jgi:hypothetical protein
VSLAIEERTEERAVVEDQSPDAPDSILNVGRARSTEVGFKADRVVERGGRMADTAAIFYVFSGVVALREVSITPSYLKRGDELEDSGKTPAVFRIEVLALGRIGDLTGRTLHRMDRVAFTLGEPNTIPLDVEVPKGRKVGVRLSLPREDAPEGELFLQIKGARKGKFPVHLVRMPAVEGDVANVAYSPEVRFTFVPRAGDIDTFENPSESLVGQINRYIERHGADGGDVEVPLVVKVQLRDAGRASGAAPEAPARRSGPPDRDPGEGAGRDAADELER